jgi:hypothetical protein
LGEREFDVPPGEVVDEKIRHRGIGAVDIGHRRGRDHYPTDHAGCGAGARAELLIERALVGEEDR